MTVLFFLLALAALVAVAVAVMYRPAFGGSHARFVAAAIAVVAAALAASMTVTTVDARSVGIQTSFGKYRDTLGSGLHLTAPWSDVEEWTTRNQTIRFAGDGKGSERDNYFTEPQITVRLGNQSEAYVDVTVTWNVTTQGVEGLWRQHRTFADARQDFAVPAALGATNAVFDGYDPFKSLNTATVESPYIPLEEWSRRIADKLRPMYADRGVNLVAVQATKVAYDKRTEDKLREYADAVANTRIKAQDVDTAKNEALASKERAAQAAPGCEALIRDLAARDQLKNLPMGWQCPGTTGPGIVVGGAR
jgi:regulator of protease activity HflC (stomatin/prohibitin superfamily)